MGTSEFFCKLPVLLLKTVSWFSITLQFAKKKARAILN